MNEIEKQFFDAFGIEPKTDKVYGMQLDYYIEDYPQITDCILLKLICYLSRYDLDLVPEHACFKDVDQLREHVLRCALRFKSGNSVPVFYMQDLQELFKG